jgi:hypothetical protein
VEPKRDCGLDAVVAELGADLRHLASDVTELKHDVRRIDGRVFQMLILQVATLATLVAALVTPLVS